MSLDNLAAQASPSAPASNEAPQTPAADLNAAPVSTPDSANPASGESVVPNATETPAWQPDFKFKAGGAEHEIEEVYRSLVKDQETLDKVRRLHEKAYGLDSMEQSRNLLKQKVAELTPRIQEYETVSKNFAKLSHFVQNKDYDSFFSALGIPEKNIVSWIQQKIEMSKNPQLLQQHEQNRKLTASQWEREQELAHYKAQAEEFERIQAQEYVQSEIQKTAADIAKLYDERMGQPNAFAEAVITKGVQLTQALGKEPDLHSVINMVKSDLQKLGLGTAPQAPNGAPAPNAPAATQVTQPKPTIPVVKAGGQSPVKQPIRSMDDLKKLAATFQD